eukprot:g9493.t4
MAINHGWQAAGHQAQLGREAEDLRKKLLEAEAQKPELENALKAKEEALAKLQAEANKFKDRFRVCRCCHTCCNARCAGSGGGREETRRRGTAGAIAGCPSTDGGG